ncbi:MAG: hypothetical protein QOJ42_4305, partial [Acidobacteriaceae bacterium]|nr:hypothetical protein [Acidobacteriaceae bacterium]
PSPSKNLVFRSLLKPSSIQFFYSTNPCPSFKGFFSKLFRRWGTLRKTFIYGLANT